MTDAAPRPEPAFGIWSQQRLHPLSRSAQQHTTKLLSIIDATVARFTPSGALWFYDSSESVTSSDPTAQFDDLRRSLQTTLDSYPHWAGRLRWARPDDVPASQRHAGRLVVEYGGADDPGVDLCFCRHEARLEDICPSQAARRSTQRAWEATSFPQAAFLNPSPLALDDFAAHHALLPSTTVQLNAFACGGYGIAIQVAHPLADAHALAIFVRHWAAENQALHGNEQALQDVATPIFDPALLDAHAAPVSLGVADAAVTAWSRSLPIHRYNWWGLDDKAFPAWAVDKTKANMALLPPGDAALLTPATPAPWETWDAAAKVSHVFFRFSAAQTSRLRDLARSGPGAAPDISRLDALLAHMWILLNRARAKVSSGTADTEDDPTVYLDLTLGLRARVVPPLPDAFVGSPIMLVHVSSPQSALVGVSSEVAAAADDDDEEHVGRLAAAASAIRTTLRRFDGPAVATCLHDAAHEPVPQRLWGGFLGGRHLLVTSWVRLDLYSVCFFSDQQPRLVRGVMPPCDGLVQVQDTDRPDELDVSVQLATGTMARLLGLAWDV